MLQILCLKSNWHNFFDRLLLFAIGNIISNERWFVFFLLSSFISHALPFLFSEILLGKLRKNLESLVKSFTNFKQLVLLRCSCLDLFPLLAQSNNALLACTFHHAELTSYQMIWLEMRRYLILTDDLPTGKTKFGTEIALLLLLVLFGVSLEKKKKL